MKDKNATVIVDISENESIMFKRLSRDIRRGIKKAKKIGLSVEKSDDWEKGYEVYKRMCERNGIVPRSFERFKYGADSLFICKKENETIAMAVNWFINKYDINIPRLHFSAMLREYSDLRPNSFLYWRIFLWYKRKGYEKYDLGGWQIKPRDNLSRVNKFKEGFGNVVYFKEEYPFVKALSRKLIRNIGAFWWLNKKIKGHK